MPKISRNDATIVTLELSLEGGMRGVKKSGRSTVKGTAPRRGAAGSTRPASRAGPAAKRASAAKHTPAKKAAAKKALVRKAPAKKTTKSAGRKAAPRAKGQATNTLSPKRRTRGSTADGPSPRSAKSPSSAARRLGTKAGTRPTREPQGRRSATPAQRPPAKLVKGRGGKGKRVASPALRSVVRIRDLDPYQKCGPGTTVERLIRVDEMVERRLEAHLVFLDRHGWYCEHGPSCHAVGHARKHAMAGRAA